MAPSVLPAEARRPWPQRLILLDLSRGLASLAVVLWHWQHFAWGFGADPATFDRKTQPFFAALRPFYAQGEYAVYYFFLLSGFIFFWKYWGAIAARRTNLWQYAGQRWSRLYPLHLATLLLVAGLQAVFVARTGRPFVYGYNDLYHFVLNLGFASRWGLERGLSFNGPVWSVSQEVLLYLLFFGAAFMRRGGLALCLGVAAAALALDGFFVPGLLRAAGMFFLGGGVYYLTAWLAVRRPAARRGVYALAALAWLLVALNYYVVDFRLPAAGRWGDLLILGLANYGIFPLTVGGLALLELDYGARWLKRVAWLGDITYATYLLHFPLQLGVALGVSAGWLAPDFYMRRTALLAFYGALVPLAYLTYIGFERPLQQRLRRWLAPPPALAESPALGG